MARLIERAFDPKRPLVARRHFVAAGRHFPIGAPFDWKHLAVDQRRVRQMYDSGKLRHVEEEEPAPPPEPEKPAAPAPKPEPALVEAVKAAPEPETMPEDDEPQDDLTGLDIKELRNVAYAEGAPTRRSQVAQRAAIRENRNERQDQ